MDSRTAVSSRIYALLKAHNWTVYKLSVLSGLPTSTLANVLHGRCKSCNLNTLLNICRAFEIPPQDFFAVDLFSLENLDDND